jgi:hypothetical protein
MGRVMSGRFWGRVGVWRGWRGALGGGEVGGRWAQGGTGGGAEGIPWDMDGVLFWCFGVGWVVVLDLARRRVSHV